MTTAIPVAIRLATGREQTGAKPAKLILELTRLCNSRCQTCNIWRRTPGPELPPGDLLRAVGSVGADLYWVALTGGEVTLYPHLVPLVRGLVSLCPKLKLINIPLNGINPARTAGLVERIVRDNPRVQFHTTVSIDGIGQDQDDLRGAGQWRQTEATWERLRALRKSHNNLRVSAQMTVSRLNIGNAAAVMERFAKDSDTFIVAVAMGSRFYAVADHPSPALAVIGEHPPSPVRFELDGSDAAAVAALVRRYPVTGPGALLEKLFLRAVLRRMRRGSAGVPCVAGDLVLFISANGEVRPCPFFEEPMGRLQDANYDLQALAREPDAIRVRAAARSCEKCWNNCVGLPSLLASPAKALRLLGAL